MEIKVKAVEDVPQKSVQQVEEELLQKHEEEHSEQKEETSEVSKENIESNIELDENRVLSFIKDRYGSEVNSINELMEKRNTTEELPDDVRSYMNYKKETGRGFEDYVNLNKDYTKEDPDKILLDYYSEIEEGLDSDEISYLLDSKYAIDDNIHSEDEIKKRSISKKKELAKAINYFNDQKLKYNTPIESMGDKLEKDNKIDNTFANKNKESENNQQKLNERAERFQQKTKELFNEEFKGFKFNIDNKDLVYSPGDASELKKSQSNLLNVFGKYLGDNGEVSDIKGFHRAMAAAMNPDKFANYFYEQGVSSALNSQAKKTKNVDLEMRTTPQSTSKSGLRIKAVTTSSRRGLTIKSPRNKS